MRMLISLTLLLSLGACSKPETKPIFSNKAKTSTRDLQAIQARDVARTPTLPEAGLIKGKTPALSVEENIARRARNRILPLSFGEGLAGITMKTTRNESKAILSEPSNSTDYGLDIFEEGFNIIWNEGVNPTPQSIRVFDKYRGPVKLPAPYGDVTVGQDLSVMLKADPEYKTFAQTLGKVFTGSEDCLAAKTCAIEKRANETFIDFPNGTIIFFHNVISVIDIATNASFASKITTPSLPGQNLAGITLEMNRIQVEAVLGAPYRYPMGQKLLYDAKTIQVEYRASDSIERIFLVPGHQGKIKLGKIEATIGSTFAGLTANQKDPDGKLLTIALAQIVSEKGADYDCTKDEVVQCFFWQNPGLLSVQLGNTVYTFMDDDNRTLITLYMFNHAE